MEVFYFRLAERLMVAACVPILLYIGYRLFESGATGKMTLTAKAEGRFAKLTNLSPGALCFALGVTLGAVVISQDVRVEEPTGIVVSGFGGAPSSNTHRRLSDVIESAYSTIGMSVQTLVARPTATIAEVDSIIQINVDQSPLTERVTETMLDAIKKLESGEIDDHEALARWRQRLLGRGE